MQRAVPPGQGRSAKVANLYCEVNENIKAYGVASHRHTPEIEEQLSYAAGCPVVLNFTPHLVPMNRGILVTAYASLKEVKKQDGSLGLPDAAMIRAAYDKYYQDEKFVRVLPEGVCPETKWVEGSNFVDVNVKVDPRTKRVIMMGAMDNLVKGAAGQAVQNMNLMFGLEESEGPGSCADVPVRDGGFPADFDRPGSRLQLRPLDLQAKLLQKRTGFRHRTSDCPKQACTTAKAAKNLPPCLQVSDVRCALRKPTRFCIKVSARKSRGRNAVGCRGWQSICAVRPGCLRQQRPVR